MKVLETAILTDTVFHGTQTNKAISILRQNKFILAFSKVAAENEHAPSAKYHFFLSTARSKTSAYLVNGNQSCIFVLDGRKLSQRYSARPVNYWNRFDNNFKDEKEDRLFSKDATIPNAASYIKEIQVHLQDINKNSLKTLLLAASKRNIPVKVFHTFKGLLTNNPKQILSKEEIQDYIKGATKVKQDMYSLTKPEELAVYTYGYSILEEALEKQKSFQEVLISKRYRLTKMAKKVSAHYLLNHIAPYRYSDFNLGPLMSNARRSATPEIANELQKVSRLMRTLRVSSLEELHAKFYAKRMELESVVSKKKYALKFEALKKDVSKIIKADMQVEEGDYILNLSFNNAAFKTKNVDRIKESFQIIKRRAFLILGADKLIFNFSNSVPSPLHDLLLKEGFTDYKNEYYMSGYSYDPYEKQIASDLEHQDALNKTGFWGKQGAGCIVFAKDTKRFLIAHRSRFVEQPNTWGTFGGAIDSNENPLNAVKRELKEETGYSGSVTFKKVFTFKHQNGFTFYNFIAVVPKEFTPKLDWENQDYKWISFGDWPKPLHFGLESVLKDRNSINVMKSLSGEK